jgi:hypothetical protein
MVRLVESNTQSSAGPVTKGIAASTEPGGQRADGGGGNDAVAQTPSKFSTSSATPAAADASAGRNLSPCDTFEYYRVPARVTTLYRLPAPATPSSSGSSAPSATPQPPSVAPFQQAYNDALAEARNSGQVPYGPYLPGREPGSPGGPKVPQAVTDAWNKLHIARLQQNYNDALSAARNNGQLPYGPYLPGREPGSPGGPKVPQAVTDAWNKLQAAKTLAATMPPPLTGLTSPLGQALGTEWRNAANDTDPANTKQDQIIEASTAVQLWSGEAAGRQGLATRAQQDTAAAKAQYGENSPQYLAALARENAAWTAVWQANANANQAAAQLGVYAADPSYTPAMNGAKTVIDAGLKPLGKQWNIPQAQGSLSDAQTELAQATQAVRQANQTLQKFQDAGTAFSQLPDKYDPSVPYKEPGVSFTAQNGPSQARVNAEREAAYYHNQLLYFGGLKDMADGNKLLADASVGALKQQLALLKPGTGEYDEIQSALTEAGGEQAKAVRAQTYYNLAAANDHVAQVNLQFENIKEQALAAAYQTNPYWFDQNGYGNLKGEHSGKLTDIKVTIGKDGQLYAKFTYENWTNDIQLTHQPGTVSDRWKAVSAEWASFNAPARSANRNAGLPNKNIVDLANYQQVLEQQAVNTLQEADARQRITDLTTAYTDAAAKAGISIAGSPDQPDAPIALPGKAMPPEVTAAWSNLQAGRQDYAQLYPEFQKNEKRLAFLASQDLSNLDDEDRQNELMTQYFEASLAEQQRVLTPLAQQYGKPILLQGKAGSQLQVWDTPDKLKSEVGAALNGQSPDITAVTDKIQELAGKDGTVQVLPTFFAPNGGGLIQSALFLVTDAAGHQHIVDGNGREHDTLDNYAHDPKLPVGGTLYFPTLKASQQGTPAYQLVANVTGQASAPSSFEFDAQGNAVIQTLKIDGPSKAMQAVDTLAGVATSAATVLSFTPLAPFAVPIAVAGGTYLGIRAGMDLYDMHEHGQSLTGKEGLMDMAMVATSVLPVAGGTIRLAGLMRAGMDFAPAFRTSFNALYAKNLFAGPFPASSSVAGAKLVVDGAPGLFAAARGLDFTAGTIGGGTMLFSTYDTLTNWGQLSDLDKFNNILSFVTGLYGVGMGARAHLKAMPDTRRLPKSRGRVSEPGSILARDPANGSVVPVTVFPRLMERVTPLLDEHGILDSAHLIDPSNQAKRTAKTPPFALFTDKKTGTNFLIPTLSRGQLRGLVRNGAIIALAIPAAALAHKAGVDGLSPLMAGSFIKLPGGMQAKWRGSKTRNFLTTSVPRGAKVVFITFPKKNLRRAALGAGVALPGVEGHELPLLDAQGVADWGNGNFFGRALVLIPTAVATARGKLNPLSRTGFTLRAAAGSSFWMNALNNYFKVAGELPHAHWHPTWAIASQAFFALGQTLLGARSFMSARQGMRLRRYAGFDRVPLKKTVTPELNGSWKRVARKAGIPLDQLLARPGNTLKVWDDATSQVINYVVQDTDTVRSIAEFHGDSPKEIRSRNNLVESNDPVTVTLKNRKGKEIKVPEWTFKIEDIEPNTPWKRVARKTSTPLIHLPGIADGVTLKIRKPLKVGEKDTLSGIANKYSIAEDDLLKENNLPQGAQLTPGLKIVVPLDVPGAATDTLASLAKKYGDKPSAIYKRNKDKLLTSPGTRTTLTGPAYIWESSSNASRALQIAGGYSMAAASGSLFMVDLPKWGMSSRTLFAPADLAIAIGTSGTATLTWMRNKIGVWKGQRGVAGAVGRALGNPWTLSAFQITSASALGWKGLGHELTQHNPGDIYSGTIHNLDLP